MSACEQQWKLDTLPPSDRADRWREVVAQTHLPWQVWPTVEASAPYNAWVRRRQAGDCFIIDCTCDPCAGRRERTQITQTTGEYVAVLMVLSGREVLSQGDREAVLSPGDLVLWDSVAPAQFAVTAPLRKRTLLVPRQRMLAVCPRLDRVLATPRSLRTPALSLFRDYLESLQQLLPSLPPDVVSAAMDAALELLIAGLNSSMYESRPALHAGLRARVKEYIRQHLGDRALRPERLAAEHAISVRTLHLLFQEEDDTVGSYIRRQRLARCRADLLRADPRPGHITEVALRWGFADPGHFSRVYRQQYGHSPREALNFVAHNGGTQQANIDES